MYASEIDLGKNKKPVSRTYVAARINLGSCSNAYWIKNKKDR